MSFKWFNYRKVGNFSTKCPYAKNESRDDEEDHNIKERKSHNHKMNYKRVNMKRKNIPIVKEKSLLQSG